MKLSWRAVAPEWPAPPPARRRLPAQDLPATLQHGRPALRKALHCHFIDFSELDRLGRWIDRQLARPRGGHHLRLLLSELFIPTDHENHEFNFWVSRQNPGPLAPYACDRTVPCRTCYRTVSC